MFQAAIGDNADNFDATQDAESKSLSDVNFFIMQ